MELDSFEVSDECINLIIDMIIDSSLENASENCNSIKASLKISLMQAFKDKGFYGDMSSVIKETFSVFDELDCLIDITKGVNYEI